MTIDRFKSSQYHDFLMNMKPHAMIALTCLTLAGCRSAQTPSPDVRPPDPPPSSTAESSASSLSSPAVRDETIVTDLTIPWSIAFLPEGDMLVTERPGTLIRISRQDQARYPIQGVLHRGEGGLLGIALHPDFASNRFVYLYMTTTDTDTVTNRVERYRFSGDELTDRVTIIDSIPGATYHDGGRLAFGPDGMLYVTTGDAQEPNSAQDTSSLAGKILRVRPDGSIPADNPFSNAVHSYGHRNPQGLAWDDQGRLWSTEHGRSGIRSGFDELNLIERGGNYGWPEIQGDETQAGMISPMLHSGPDVTWAPASAAHLSGSILFGGLKGETLYEAVLTDGKPVLKTHLQGEYGRLRDTVVHDGMIYVTTSNRDGRGAPSAGDDRIVRVQPDALP